MFTELHNINDLWFEEVPPNLLTYTPTGAESIGNYGLKSGSGKQSEESQGENEFC